AEKHSPSAYRHAWWTPEHLVHSIHLNTSHLKWYRHYIRDAALPVSSRRLPHKSSAAAGGYALTWIRCGDSLSAGQTAVAGQHFGKHSRSRAATVCGTPRQSVCPCPHASGYFLRSPVGPCGTHPSNL